MACFCNVNGLDGLEISDKFSLAYVTVPSISLHYARFW